MGMSMSMNSRQNGLSIPASFPLNKPISLALEDVGSVSASEPLDEVENEQDEELYHNPDHNQATKGATTRGNKL